MTITLTLDRDALLPVLDRAASVVEARNTIPVLSHLLLRIAERALHITGTDLDITVAAPAPARIEGAGGAFTAPAGMLHDIVRKLPEGAAITMAVEGDKLTLRAGRSRFTLSTLPAEDFPDLPEPDIAHRFMVPRKTLEAMLARVNFAISTEETRYYLNGVHWHVQAGKLVSVATDGHRLALMRSEECEAAQGMPGIIIPRKTVLEVLKLLKTDRSEEIAVEICQAKIRFQIGSTRLISKLIDGTFPDYQRIIPQRNDKRATIECETFVRAVDRVATISSERGRAIRLQISQSAIALSVINPDAGSSSEEIDARFDGADMEIGFNARYLADAIGAIGGEQAIIALADSGSPALFTSEADEQFLTLLMPMRV